MTQQALSKQNGAFMKIILIGANGKIGELVQKALAGAGHEIVQGRRKSGEFQVGVDNRECVRAHDAKRSRMSFAPVLHRHDSGRRVESWPSLQTRYLGGANRPRLQS